MQKGLVKLFHKVPQTDLKHRATDLKNIKWNKTIHSTEQSNGPKSLNQPRSTLPRARAAAFKPDERDPEVSERGRDG